MERSTIARHHLSDQSDPFNRAPLTMDMVESDNLLKERVDKWIEERKSGIESGEDKEEGGGEAGEEPEEKKEKLEEVVAPVEDVKMKESLADFELD